MPLRQGLHGCDTDQAIMLDRTALDAGSGLVTILRAGLVLGRIAATGLYKQYDPAATDGSERALLVLGETVDLMMDSVDGLTPRRQYGTGICHGFLCERALLGLDAAARAALRGILLVP